MTVQLYYSSVSGNIMVKKQQQQIQSFLESKKIPFELIDIAASEKSKEEMKKCSGKAAVPQIFVNGSFKGLYEDFENAAEDGLLEQFFQ